MGRLRQRAAAGRAARRRSTARRPPVPRLPQAEAQQRPAAPRQRPARTWPQDTLDLAACLGTAALLGLVTAGAAGPARAWLVFGFAFFVPGRAIAAHWPALAGWSQAAVPVGLSLAVTAAVTTLMLWWHAWHPVALLQVLGAASLLALAAAIVRRHRSRPAPGRAAAGPAAGAPA